MLISALVHAGAFWGYEVFIEKRVLEQERFQVWLAELGRELGMAERLRTARPKVPTMLMERLSWQGPMPEVRQRPAAAQRMGASARMDTLHAEVWPALEPVEMTEEWVEELKPPKKAFERYRRMEATEAVDFHRTSLDMELELLRVQDLDTGRDRAVMLMDSDDRKNLSGTFNVTLVDFQGAEFYDVAMPNLVQYLNAKTGIVARIAGKRIELSSPELFKIPFLYMTGRDRMLLFTEVALENLGRYLREGGFAFIEDIGQRMRGTPFDQQMRSVLRQVLGSDAKFFVLPKDHPIYHSYYDFYDGPPLGGDFWDYGQDKPLEQGRRGNVDYLEGIEIEGRLTVLFSDVNLSSYWGSPHAEGRERGLQFGVNIIAYALTQAGGLARRIAMLPKPVRSYEGDVDCYLSVFLGKSAEEVDLGKVVVLLDDRKLKGVFDEAGYVGFVVSGLRGGKRRAEVRYEDQSAAIDVVLKGGHVVAVTFGLDRLAFARRLWVRDDGEYETYKDWKAHYAKMDIRVIGNR
jgi:hypothetical protein